jgi:hypothetical protein
MAYPTVCSAWERDRGTMVRFGALGTPGPDGAESLLQTGRSIFRQGRVRIQIRIQGEA